MTLDTRPNAHKLMDMKTLLALLAPLALAVTAHAQSSAVLYSPATQTTVVSPLTSTTPQANQALLNQINNTISERTFEHQVLTMPSQPATPTLFYTTPRVVRAE